jgi:hypothetical protein
MLKLTENHSLPRTAAFFDLDKTVIAKSSTLTFSKSFYQGGGEGFEQGRPLARHPANPACPLTPCAVRAVRKKQFADIDPQTAV